MLICNFKIFLPVWNLGIDRVQVDKNALSLNSLENAKMGGRPRPGVESTLIFLKLAVVPTSLCL